MWLYPSGHAYYLIRVWKNYVGDIVLPNCLWKFRKCFFNFKQSIGHIPGMVGPIDVKRKGGASVGYWVNYVTSTFHSWPWPCSFKVNIWNSHICGMGGLVDLEKRGYESTMHDHECDLWWCGLMYSIVTGLTSNVNITSTYLFFNNIKELYSLWRLYLMEYHLYVIWLSSAMRN